MTQFELSKIGYAYTLKNIKIVLNEEVSNDKCLVLFSSNGLYYPNTNTCLDRVIDNDVYEWINLYPKNHFKKVIFVRDVLKQWYVNGINKDVNSLSRLQEVISFHTSGFSCTFVGSSAGGFAAVYFGCRLNAYKIITISGQFDISRDAEDYNKNPVLFKHTDRRDFDLSTSVFDKRNIYYIYPSKSFVDKVQYEKASQIQGVKVIRVSSSIHGLPFQSFSCRNFLKASDICLDFLVLISKYVSINRHFFSLIFINPRDFLFKISKGIRLLTKQ